MIRLLRVRTRWEVSGRNTAGTVVGSTLHISISSVTVVMSTPWCFSDSSARILCTKNSSSSGTLPIYRWHRGRLHLAHLDQQRYRRDEHPVVLLRQQRPDLGYKVLQQLRHLADDADGAQGRLLADVGVLRRQQLDRFHLRERRRVPQHVDEQALRQVPLPVLVLRAVERVTDGRALLGHHVSLSSRRPRLPDLSDHVSQSFAH